MMVHGQYTPPYLSTREKVFAALELVAPEDVKVVIVGQDLDRLKDYLSLPDRIKTQPSMQHPKKLKDDIGIERCVTRLNRLGQGKACCC